MAGRAADHRACAVSTALLPRANVIDWTSHQILVTFEDQSHRRTATMGLQRHDEVVLLLGAPGAGKGTQARFLAATLGVPMVASGDLLREHRQRGTDLGRAAQEFMDRGDLVPDELVVDMIVHRLDAPDAMAGVLLDGFPRNVAQADALEARLIERGGAIRVAVYVDVPTT